MLSLRRLASLIDCRLVSLLLYLILLTSPCHGKESKKKQRSREKQHWTVAATSPLGGNPGVMYAHWVCFAKDDDDVDHTGEIPSSSSSQRGEKLSCCQEIYRLMKNEAQLCWQYPTGDCGSSSTTSRAEFLRLCSQNIAQVPSYLYLEEKKESSSDVVVVSPPRWSLVVSNMGESTKFNPVEFWRQCISYSVSAGHWYYTVRSPFRLATETPASDKIEDHSLATNVTSAIKGNAIDFSLSFNAPNIDETIPLKASLTFFVTLPEAVQILKKNSKQSVHCSSNLRCNVTTQSTATERVEAKKKTSKLPTEPQRVVVVSVDLHGDIQSDTIINLRLTIPLRVMEDESDFKVIPVPVLQASAVQVGDRSFTLVPLRKQRLGTPLVLAVDGEEEEL